MESSKIALLGKTLYEIQQITANLGMPKFAAKQITSWLYDKKVGSIDDMTNLSLKHREALKAAYEGGASEPSLINLYKLSIFYNVSLDAFLNPNIPIEEIFKYPKKNT